ncbi:MAG: DUF5420 family protein [Candidatus Izemoplasma sp.]
MFYKLNKKDSKGLWDGFQVLKKEPEENFAKLHKKFLKDYQAESLIENKWSLGSSATGYIPTDQENIPKWAKTRDYWDEGSQTEKTIIDPNRTFKEGKKLDARLKELTEAINKIPDFQLEISSKLGLKGEMFMVSSGDSKGGKMVREVVRIGYMKGQMIMEVPDVHLKHYEINSDLIKIKKSEFIAITEE